MKKYLLLLVCLGLIACGSSETIKRLNIIFDYIQEDPERAYDELSDIKPDALKSNQERGLYSLLFSIPIVGFILLIVFSFNDNNINRRNFARSFFCMFLVALIIAIIFGILCAVLGSQFIASLRGSMRPYY